MMMKVSRREFVSTASYAAAAASLCALPSFGLAASGADARGVGRCTLLDLESNCVLPESLAGLRAALGKAHRYDGVKELAGKEFSSSDFVSRGVGSVLVVA